MTSFRSRPRCDALDEMLPDMSGLAAENVQARLRMVALMALSNAGGQMLLTTGNKSEMSVGYATLYGDMAGGYSVLKDAYKTTVFALSRWRNANKPEGALGPDGPVMPARVITKPPTAELRPGQKDEDSLPPYSVLDRILEGLVDKEMSVKEVATATGEDVGAGRRHRNQAAQGRIQAPPGAAGREDRQPQLRPRPPLPDQQLLPHRPGTKLPHDRRHPLRALADRPAARRQHPHRAAQLPVRAEEWRQVHPPDRRHRPRALDRRVRSRRSATISTGWASRPDQIVRQSERFDLYEREFERLKAAGRVYACYETPEELDLRRKVLLGRGLPPVYERKPADAPVPEGPGAALALQARP